MRGHTTREARSTVRAHAGRESGSRTESETAPVVRERERAHEGCTGRRGGVLYRAVRRYCILFDKLRGDPVEANVCVTRLIWGRVACPQRDVNGELDTAHRGHTPPCPLSGLSLDPVACL
eukprot:4987919-Prymnesium_polylepis.2